MSATDQMVESLTLFGEVCPIRVVRLTRARCNQLLIDWCHELGACDRPFGQDQWGLVVGDRITSVAVSASIISPTVTDATGSVWPRSRAVELARICTRPGENWATRPMLRLWRAVLVHEWEHWPVDLAVSYATPGQVGHIYRHDGWTRVRQVKRSSPGATSTWSKPSATDVIGDGRKTLWTYKYERSAA